MTMQNKKIEIKCFGFQNLELDYFTEFQGDLKTLSDEALKQIKAQILELGFSEPISVWQNEGSNFILNGHQRIKALKSFRDEGYFIPAIPINVVEADDFDQAKKKVLALASQYGEVSNEGYARYLSDNNIDIRYARDNYRMPEVDYEKMEKRFVSDEEKKEIEDSIPEDVPTIAKLGDIWQLGEHRLMCGDSTNKNQVEMLMDGQKADIAFTSPPYNLGNNAKLRGYNGDGEDSAYIEKSDHKSQDEYLSFLSSFTLLAMKYSTTVFINIQLLAGNKLALPKYWMAFHDKLIDLMIWDKEHAQPSAARRVLNSVFEMVFIFTDEQYPKRSIKTGKPFRGTIQNIFRLNPMRERKDVLAKDHGAVFPVAFCSFFIDNFSQNSVLDLFGGSGTTLIASEKTNRKCFMMELDPHYVDIIIKRWEQYSGKTAIKITSINE